ncbi:MAG: S-layer homology domain-containing protein [Candidatus Eremiobacteraeota bacterium]|nr:S-layer homology domain-containing protein [Candidatus Eremiobacteraeota bacterium]
MKRGLILAMLLIAPALARPPMEGLVERGLMQGYRDGQLQPDRAVTRNELAQMVNNLREDLDTQHERLGDASQARTMRTDALALRSELEALARRIDDLRVDSLEQRAR